MAKTKGPHITLKKPLKNNENERKPEGESNTTEKIYR
jgi:hypothetical protein